jgi:CheY-like chemotaxis protein
MTDLMERPLTEGDSVAVIDDIREDAELTASLVSEAGFTPVVITPPPSSLTQLLERVRTSARAVICDHRLAGRGEVPYYGAEVVAKSNANHLPAVLITTYADAEAHSIRLWRSGIPRLLRRGRESDPDTIYEALIQADREADGTYEPNRKPYRVVVRVETVRKIGGIRLAEVVVPAWNPSEVVEIPVSLITQDSQQRKFQLSGARFIAYVNIYAETPDELYFRDFEPAPEIPNGWPNDE